MGWGKGSEAWTDVPCTFPTGLDNYSRDLNLYYSNGDELIGTDTSQKVSHTEHLRLSVTTSQSKRLIGTVLEILIGCFHASHVLKQDTLP